MGSFAVVIYLRFLFLTLDLSGCTVTVIRLVELLVDGISGHFWSLVLFFSSLKLFKHFSQYCRAAVKKRKYDNAYAMR